MEFLTVILSAFVLLMGYAVWDDLKENRSVGWGKILLGIGFFIFLLFILFT